MAKKSDTKIKLLTKVAKGVAFGDVSNTAVRNILTEISKELYGGVTEDQMRETLDFFKWRCPYTGVDLRPLIEGKVGGYAADHIYPQNKEWCGLNVQGNLIFVTTEANKAKRGIDVETFLLTDTKVLADFDEVGNSRKQRLDKIREFQDKFKYDPEKIRKIVLPLMEERYKLVREEQEECICVVMKALEAAGIKPAEKAVTKSPSTSTARSGKSGKGYTYDEKIGVANYYLTHDEGLIHVEENYMKLIDRHGATAKSILNQLGIDTARSSNHRGLLILGCGNIDDEISKATGTFKITLEEIKKRKLI